MRNDTLQEATGAVNGSAVRRTGGVRAPVSARAVTRRTGRIVHVGTMRCIVLSLAPGMYVKSVVASASISLPYTKLKLHVIKYTKPLVVVAFLDLHLLRNSVSVQNLHYLSVGVISQ